MRTLMRIAAAGVLLAPLAWGAVTPQEAAQLGEQLTPLGGEKAGNADGSIPAWSGGITSAAAAGFPSYRPGDHHPDPYAADTPLFTITAANLQQYAAKLTQGHKALLETYPDYKMDVYPTHRSAAVPERIAEATQRIATTAELLPGGNAVTGAAGGVPFPIPKSGLEVLWNHLLRFRGVAVARQIGQVALSAGVRYTARQFKEEFFFPCYVPGMREADPDNILAYFMRETLAAARPPGDVLLVQEPLDQRREERRAWIYNPGQRRVRRAPQIAFDNPAANADNLRTNDQFDMYNGSPQRYDWKLLGKQAMYVPYNSYRLQSAQLKLTATCCTPITSTRTTRATNCTACGWWMQRSSRGSVICTRGAPSTWTRTPGRSSRSTATTRAGGYTAYRRVTSSITTTCRPCGRTWSS